MTQYAFYFDGTRCTECKTCMFACKDYKDTDVDVNLRRVYEITGGATDVDEAGCFTTSVVSYPVSVGCQHCDHPGCVLVEPDAISRDEETGLIQLDPDAVTDVETLMAACPYGAIQLDPATGRASKCDGCIDRVRAGLKPVCVMACPCDALDFGTVEEMAAKGERADIVPFPDPALTTPNLFVKPSRDARSFDDASVEIANPLEV